MMCGQIYKTIWNDQWETAGILEKYHTVHGELKIIPLSGNVIRGGGGGRTKWGAPVNTVFANYLWESEQGGFYIDNSMQNVPHSVAQFFGNGFSRLCRLSVQAERHHWTCTPFRAASSRLAQNRFESCSFLMHFARNHTFFASFLYGFIRKTRLSYTRKRNPTPNLTPETASKYWMFGVWV